MVVLTKCQLVKWFSTERHGTNFSTSISKSLMAKHLLVYNQMGDVTFGQRTFNQKAFNQNFVYPFWQYHFGFDYINWQVS
jgi:hypothetical protein